MKHDTDVHDTDSDPAAEGGKPDGRPVNTSRRRFTRAGLSASAVMTLASRPALGNLCSSSAHTSGNHSHAGMRTTCLGLSSGFWKTNESQWVNTTCDPGKCNALTMQNDQCMDYDFCTWGELKAASDAAAEAKDGATLDRLRAYQRWANWNDESPADAKPNPNPVPTTVGQVLDGTGLQLVEPSQTMMQMYWNSPGDEPDSLMAEACTAFLNVDYFGSEAFGYTTSELKTFISNWSGGLSELKDALHYLNNRGS